MLVAGLCHCQDENQLLLLHGLCPQGELQPYPSSPVPTLPPASPGPSLGGQGTAESESNWWHYYVFSEEGIQRMAQDTRSKKFKCGKANGRDVLAVHKGMNSDTTLLENMNFTITKLSDQEKERSLRAHLIQAN
ncbi:hypothetical protein Tco_1291617 [Tanacetum coccineum]